MFLPVFWNASIFQESAIAAVNPGNSIRDAKIKISFKTVLSQSTRRRSLCSLFYTLETPAPRRRIKKSATNA